MCLLRRFALACWCVDYEAVMMQPSQPADLFCVVLAYAFSFPPTFTLVELMFVI